MKITTKLWIALVVLIVLSPLGLMVPAWIGAEGAWGEWGAQEVRELVGYLPAEMGRLSELWKAPLPDYALQGQESAPLSALSASYILSAVVGVAAVVIVAVVVGRLLARRDESDAA